MREGKDIFGFEGRGGKAVPPAEEDDRPVMGLHADVIVEYMMSQSVDGVEPVMEFSNHIRWGKGHGAIEMVISPFGSYKSIIRRMQPDLEGRNVWACKRVIPYKDILDANLEIDEKLGMVIMEQVNKVRGEDTESPSHEWGGMRSLVRRMGGFLQRRDVLPEVFIYTGTKEVEKDRKYLLSYELKGHGVEAPGSSRVEQFLIDMVYDPKTGMVRSFGYEVQSPTSGHLWYPQPSEWDEFFSSGQKQNEILECVAGAMSTY